MFTRKLTFFAALVAVAAAVTTASALSWQKVYEARDKGLPKTAIEELKPIIADAIQGRRHAEAIKAICMKIAFEGNIEGNKPEKKITRLEAEIAQAPAEMKPLMEAVLANWYWHYFQHNRWRFQQRTQTAEAPGKDFTTWDLPRILAEIDRHFTVALAGEKLLKSTPVEQYNDLLEKGSVSDAYRPTLFDFLAHEALQFYQAGEQGAAAAEDEFEIADDNPVFGTVDEFLKWRPGLFPSQSVPRKDKAGETPGPSPLAGEGQGEGDSPKLKAIRLFQNLLAFHRNDGDKTALMDADLWRLTFGKNQAVGPAVNDRYKAALQRFAEQGSSHEISARALHQLALLLNEEDQPAEAHAVAKRGAEAHPKSVGGIWCANLVRQIESEQVNISTERVWNEPWPTISVQYKNLTQAYFRAVPYDFDRFMSRQRWGFGYGWDEKFHQELLTAKPAAAWNTALPATADFRMRTEKVPVARDLKPGFYFILASHDPAFGKKDNQVSMAYVWVSELALVVRQRHSEGALDGFVLKALTGEPVAGATVRSWARDREGWMKPASQVQTDTNGMFRFDVAGDSRQLFLLAQSDGQAVSGDNEYYVAHGGKVEPHPQAVFFTDRSLYRPGQTIQYKGICYRADSEKNEYRTLEGQTLTVVLRDPNGREVARQQQKCNDYGSFSGSFTAPGGTVTGRMTLQVLDGPSGATSISVEEYKRPKFQVELAAPKEAAKLGSEVSLSGKATAYTGAAIGGAKVKWRVVREVQFPPWCWWGRWFLPPGSESRNIAHGTATTGPDGSFTVVFPAVPDLSVVEKTEPVFCFKVHADVTDTTGETRSDSRTVKAGYTALAANLRAGEWQTPDVPVEWTIQTQSLDGDPQAAAGEVKVYALKQPGRVERPPLEQGRPYGFPHSDRWLVEPEPDPSNADSWELGEVVARQEFKTDATGTVKLTTPLKAGIYRAMLETRDRFGKAVTARQTLQVLDPKGTRYPVRLASHFAAPKWSVEPGGRFVALWGTGYDTGRAYVELEHQGRILRAFWTGEGATQEKIEQAVDETMRGGFSIRVTYVRENRAHLQNRIVDVPWSNKKLEVRWERFTSKLGPAQKDTWTAVVTGPDARKAVAEMVATLYDASLDQYQPYEWMRGFGVFRREFSRVHPQFENGVAGFQHIHGGWDRESRHAELTYRHYPADISANLWGYGYLAKGRVMHRSFAMAAPMAAKAADGVAMLAAAPMEELAATESEVVREDRDASANAASDKRSRAKKQEAGSVEPDLDKVTARKNLNETAFFFPHLVSDQDGVVRMEFTMPEALTEWKFMGFAHDKELRSGFLTNSTVTAKDLMVEPNPPRFVREGDVIEFTTKVSNQSAARQTGKVRLTLADARTLKAVNSEFRIQNPECSFDIPAGEARSFSWRMTIPDGADVLTYKVVGATDRLSDGEEGYLPVLSRRILVTESLPLPIRGAQTKRFEFGKLVESGKSRTLRH